TWGSPAPRRDEDNTGAPRRRGVRCSAWLETERATSVLRPPAAGVATSAGRRATGGEAASGSMVPEGLSSLTGAEAQPAQAKRWGWRLPALFKPSGRTPVMLNA